MKKRMILTAIIAAALVLGCACGKGENTKNTSAAGETAASAEAENAGPKVTQILVSGAGDVTLGSDVGQPEDVNFTAVYNEVNDPAYFFKNVKSIFGADDMTLVNFEGTLTDGGSREDKTFAFRGDPSYVNILKEGSVEAVAFANNHCKDYGEESYTDTMKYLDEAGIVYSSFETVGVYEAQGKKLGMVSVSGLRGYDEASSLISEGINKLRAQDADAIIVSIHGGIEHEYSVTDEQKEIAHYAVDAGADLVLCHHPHVVQGVEKYNNVYIAYSLGNFCFGGNTNPSDKDTLIFQKTFTFVDDDLVLDDAVKAIPCSISSTSSINNYQPTPKEGEAFTEGINKLNEYSQPFDLVFADDGSIQSVNGVSGFAADASTAVNADKRSKTAAAAGAATGEDGTDAGAAGNDGSDGTADSAEGADTDGSADGTADANADGAAAGTVDASADGSADSTVDASADGAAAGTVDASADGSADSTVDASAAGAADSTVDASADGSAAGTVDASADGSAGNTGDTGTDRGSNAGTKKNSSVGLTKHRDLLKDSDKIFALQ